MQQLIGIVEDNLDPDLLGRVKCRVLGIHTQKLPNGQYILSTDDLPWCRNGNMKTSGSSTGAGDFSNPKLGSFLCIKREDDYTFIYENEVYMSDDLKSIFEKNQNDYQNAHILIYDTCLGSSIDDDNKPVNNRKGEYVKVYYTDSEGFVIDVKNMNGSNKIQIDDKGTINVKTSNGNEIVIDNINDKISIKSNSKISLDAENIELGKDATESIIKGDIFKEYYNKHTHTTPNGASGPPIIGIPSNCLSNKNKTN